jgi:hypothetical protein
LAMERFPCFMIGAILFVGVVVGATR